MNATASLTDMPYPKTPAMTRGFSSVIYEALAKAGVADQLFFVQRDFLDMSELSSTSCRMS